MRRTPIHLTDGEIRAHQDDQLDPAGENRVQSHLAACEPCRLREGELQNRSARIETHLADLQPAATNPMKAPTARRQLAARLQIQPEERSMITKLTSKISRPAWTAIALVAVLAIAMIFPPVRAAANSFLQLFRVEQVRIIPVDMNSLPGDLESSAQLEALFTENVEIEDGGEPREVASADEVATLAGFGLRLPSRMEGQTSYSFQPGGTVTFNVNLEMVRAVVRELGRDDLELPGSLDGAKIRVDIPNSVAVMYGECQNLDKESFDPDQPRTNNPGQCITFLQMPAPAVSAPPDMDLQELGIIYLQVLGMSETEAALFAGTVDWTTTFVIPLPMGEANYREVQVDGVNATLIEAYRGYGSGYSLMWVKNGMVYMLSGAGEADEALEIANSIR